MWMSKNEVHHHKIDVEKRRAAGETIGEAREPRSDKGTKRPHKKAPGVCEGDKNDALPAKKQKKGKSKKGDDALPAKKQKKGC